MGAACAVPGGPAYAGRVGLALSRRSPSGDDAGMTEATRPLAGRVALVTGATRGAGRGIAIELGAAGATVYCTGRSTRERRSAYGRPETIEETAELVDRGRRRGDRRPDRPPGAGAGRGARRADRRRARPARRPRQRHLGRRGPLRVEHAGLGARPRRRPAAAAHAVDTHLITSHFALPLLIRRPGGLVVEMTDGTREYNDDALPELGVLRPRQDRGAPARLRAGHGARAARLHRAGAHAGLAALGDDARALRRHRGELARRAGRSTRTSPRSPRARASSAARSPRSPPTPTSRAATAARSRPASWRASTASPTSTARSPTAGATWSRSRTPGRPADPTGYR